MGYPKGFYRVDWTVLDESGAPTGTPVLSTRPRRLTRNYEADTFSLEGGDAVLEEGENNQRISLELEVAGLELALMAALTGETVVTTGSGATLESVVSHNINSARPHGRLRAQQREKDGGHTIYSFPNVTAGGLPSGDLDQGAYMTQTIGLTAYAAEDAVAAVVGPPAIPEVVVGDVMQIIQGATYAALSS
jgi:hypothetical protein